LATESDNTPLPDKEIAMNNLINALESNKAFTLNGMPAFEKNEDPLVSLFFEMGALRGQPERLIRLFGDALIQEPAWTRKALLHLRDIKNGMGERQSYRDLVSRFCKHWTYDQVATLMHLTVKYGRWDDLTVFLPTSMGKTAARYWMNAVRSGDGLAAKWAPREKSSKKDIAKVLRAVAGLSAKEYRQKLTRNTDVVETKMSFKEWDDIDFSKVPSVAMARYGNTFRRHAPIRFMEYLDRVQKGVEKMNAEAVFPHDVVRSVNYGDEVAADAQWRSLPDFVGDFSFLPIVDVSGSMETRVSGNIRAIDVSIGLGLYLSERNKSVFKNRFITFSEIPSWFQLGSFMTLREKISATMGAPWGMNTNIRQVFELILNAAVSSRVPQEDMPDAVLILSDMQFDRCTLDPHAGFLPMVREMYERAGYKTPTLIFWNLVSYGANFPVEVNESGVVLVSGFSPAILKGLLKGDVSKLTPRSIVEEALQRYEDW
jgi:hypothetical protein